MVFKVEESSKKFIKLLNEKIMIFYTFNFHNF